MELIRAELLEQGVTLAKENEAVILRCIHASADFDYAANLRFTPDAVRRAKEALRRGTDLVTDTNMALAGISRPGLQKLGASAYCYMAEDFIAERAKAQETTRAAAAMDWAAEHNPSAVFAVGNAPTALLRIAEQIREGLRPALVIAVPVGFVNVVESKERIFSVCEEADIPCIAAMGRKGGSSIAAAICNALIYSAADLLEPAARGWN
jgi:precorrin-8X/cobalt-precorrin-8 methylmutase